MRAKVGSELVSSGAALVATGAWFADKIFGPSAEALGDNLKAYLSSRVPTIFGVAEAKAKREGLIVKAAAPGLLARMVMDASFSNEDPQITEWWANLFLSAGHAEDNRHAVYSDIMAVVGPKEAHWLKSFVESEQFGGSDSLFRKGVPVFRGSNDGDYDGMVAKWIGETPIPNERLAGVLDRLENGPSIWPARAAFWALPCKGPGGMLIRRSHDALWYGPNRLSVEILERAGILRFVRAEIGTLETGFWVQIVELTALGAEFYSACNVVAKDHAE